MALRHFQHNASGSVQSWGPHDSDEAAESHPLGRMFTEVQVVPLDAIVVGGPLPEVVASDTGSLFARGDDDRSYAAFRTSPAGTDAVNRTPEWHEFRARQHLALAAHLREHPPVDEEQVASLFEVLTEEWFPDDDGERASTLARRLFERGVRVGGDSR